jgi:hypothetical protein
MTSDRDDLVELKRKLADRVEELGEVLFGQPTTRNARELRWGRKGSTRINLKGKSPSFFSFESGTGGSLIDAVVFANICSFAEAVEWARSWLGEDERQTPRPHRPKPKPIDIDKLEAQRIAAAKRMFSEALPIKGTPGEVYLRDKRRIAAGAWPDDLVRYHPRLGVIFASRTADGTLNAVQRVEIEATGTPKRDEDGHKIKRTRGLLAGTAVRFRPVITVSDEPSIDGPLLLAEGPETAASCWWATGFETWANLGSIARAPLAGVAKSRLVVVCRDDDRAKAPSQNALRNAIKTWRTEGRTVVEATPWPLSRGDGTDFNDLLLAQGRDAVCQRILAAIGTDEPPRPKKPSIHEARRQVAQVIGREVAELSRWVPPAEDIEAPAPFKAVKAGVGTGKTEEVLRAVARIIKTGKRAVLLVPTHKLATEAEARMVKLASELGIKVAVYHGRQAVNPATGEIMCQDLALVKEAQEAMADVEATACAVCPHRGGCAYLAQKKLLDIDLWVAPVALHWTQRPAMMNGADLLVIDEGFALDGIVGIGNAKLLVGIEDLDRGPTSPEGIAATADLVAELMPIRRKLLAALADHPLGPLQRDRLVEAGLTADDARAAYGLEWQAKITVTVGADLDRAALLEQFRTAQENPLIHRRATLWRDVDAVLTDEGAVASGRVEIVEEIDEKTGARYRALRLYDLRRPGKGWSRMPTLHLDATLDVELLKARIPRAELVADIEAVALHQRIVQVTGLTFSKVALTRSKGQLTDAWTFAKRHAQNAGGDWLVITNESPEMAIKALGPVPTYMRLGHFNGLRGIDEHRDIRGMIIIGRPMPPPAAVERLAGILTGRAVEPLAGWYPTCSTTIRARDKSAATVNAVQHPDGLADRIRNAICQAELLQIIGRARGVRRTAADPVDVYVLGNEPLPVEVARVEAWAAPTIDDHLLAAGVWLENSADAAAAYPGLVKSEASLRKARSRQRCVTFSYENLLLENVTHLARTWYRRPGPGRSWAQVVYDQRLVPDIGAWLTARLGPVQLRAAVSESEAAGQAVEVSRPIEVVVTEIRPIPPPPPDPHPGGLLDPLRIDLVRRAIRSSGVTAGAVARQAGVSLPTLSNALSRRFGLSPAAWDRLQAAAMALDRRQADIFTPQGRGPA